MSYNVKEKAQAVIDNLKRQGCTKTAHRKNIGRAVMEEVNLTREETIHKFVLNMMSLGYLKPTKTLQVFNIEVKKEGG